MIRLILACIMLYPAIAAADGRVGGKVCFWGEVSWGGGKLSAKAGKSHELRLKLSKMKLKGRFLEGIAKLIPREALFEESVQMSFHADAEAGRATLAAVRKTQHKWRTWKSLTTHQRRDRLRAGWAKKRVRLVAEHERTIRHFRKMGYGVGTAPVVTLRTSVKTSVHSKPSKRSKIVGALDARTTVTVLDGSRFWAKIRFKSGKKAKYDAGWIPTYLLRYFGPAELGALKKPFRKKGAL